MPSTASLPETERSFVKDTLIQGSLEKNLICEGNLTVTQDIAPKLSIHVKGNLVVQGVVNGSQIVVEKDAWFENGVNSHDRGRIVIHGHLRTRSLQNAELECEKSVEVFDSVLDSCIRAKKTITVGNLICGGTVSAEHSLKAKIIGCTEKKETKVESGANFKLKIMQEEMSAEVGAIREKADKIESAIRQLEQKEKSHYSGLSFQEKKLLKSSTESLEILKGQLDGLNLRKEKFEKKLQKTLDAYIEVYDKIHPGTHLVIQNRFVIAQKEYPAGKYTIREGKIIRV